MPEPDPIPELPLSSLMEPTTSWISRRRSPAATTPPSSVAPSSCLHGATSRLSPAATSWLGLCSWATASTRPNTLPTADGGSSRWIQKNCRGSDLLPFYPLAIPCPPCHTDLCLGHRQSGLSAT